VPWMVLPGAKKSVIGAALLESAYYLRLSDQGRWLAGKP
jgi:hypothetical protein